ncbi:unnamed protein product [Somion occarium]|uniref:Uncharacterized protein n=1 Tax=Somion occarium TaxID=3059160 RepID=A0ABP1DYG6_9APHY
MELSAYVIYRQATPGDCNSHTVSILWLREHHLVIDDAVDLYPGYFPPALFPASPSSLRSKDEGGRRTYRVNMLRWPPAPLPSLAFQIEASHKKASWSIW